RFLEDGMPVFDLNGEHMGDVKAYSTVSGYLIVGIGALDHKDLYIPFRLIRSITPEEIALLEPKDTLAAQFAEQPVTHTVVEHRLVPGPRGNTMPQTYEVRTVQSGYDGSPAAEDSVELGDIADRLSVGLAVYDVNGLKLGDITQYDVPRRLLVVEKGIFKPTAVVVPFSAVSRIDRDRLSVYLTLPKSALLSPHATQFAAEEGDN